MPMPMQVTDETKTEQLAVLEAQKVLNEKNYNLAQKQLDVQIAKYNTEE